MKGKKPMGKEKPTLTVEGTPTVGQPFVLKAANHEPGEEVRLRVFGPLTWSPTDIIEADGTFAWTSPVPAVAATYTAYTEHQQGRFTWSNIAETSFTVS